MKKNQIPNFDHYERVFDTLYTKALDVSEYKLGVGDAANSRGLLTVLAEKKATEAVIRQLKDFVVAAKVYDAGDSHAEVAEFATKDGDIHRDYSMTEVYLGLNKELQAMEDPHAMYLQDLKDYVQYKERELKNQHFPTR